MDHNNAFINLDYNPTKKEEPPSKEKREWEQKKLHVKRHMGEKMGLWDSCDQKMSYGMRYTSIYLLETNN